MSAFVAALMLSRVPARLHHTNKHYLTEKIAAGFTIKENDASEKKNSCWIYKKIAAVYDIFDFKSQQKTKKKFQKKKYQVRKKN